MAHISLTKLLVRDYDEAIAFYVDAVGFELREDAPLPGGQRWVVVAPRGGQSGLLLSLATTADQAQHVGDQAGGGVGHFLTTEDFAGDHGRMRNAGVLFLEEPRHEAYGTVAVFQDLYGNRWDLIAPGDARR